MATTGQAPAPVVQVEAPKREARTARRVVYLLVAIVVIGLGLWGLRRAADRHLRAISVLTRLSHPGDHGLLTRFASHPVRLEEGTAETPQGPLKYRLYVPVDVSHPAGVVMLHGIHRLGIDDPRAINFARAMAGAGIEVMTPELQDLADYHVTPRTIDTIGEAAEVLCAKMDRPKVGVGGVSFAGGLALLAAERPEYAAKIGVVLAVGAHDDMPRVAHFFAANMVERPDGSSVAFQAHEYGVLVLAYTHLEDFFSANDVPLARAALHEQLWEQPDASEKIGALSPAGQQTFDLLLHHRDRLQPTLLREIERHHDEMEAVSPHGHLSDLHVPVFLIHGTMDSVIPASETLWLAKDVPPSEIRNVLISPAMNMIHVDGQRPVPISEEWALVDFMAQLFRSTDRLARAKQ